MTKRTLIGKLEVASVLADFVNNELLPKIGLDKDRFWTGFESIINEFTSRNTRLLEDRDELQEKINEWHKQQREKGHDPAAYKKFLTEI